jgi:hypothetical protein
MVLPSFDSRISFGNILTLLGFGAGVIAAYSDLKAEQRALVERVGGIEGEAKERKTDHDILIRIESQIADVRALLKLGQRGTP